MLIYFTDVVNSCSIAINPTYVVAVFSAHDGPHLGKTVISVINGTVVVEEEVYEVIGRIQGELNQK